jgi:hypothetical protein
MIHAPFIAKISDRPAPVPFGSLRGSGVRSGRAGRARRRRGGGATRVSTSPWLGR